MVPIAYQQLIYPVTGISISITENIHVTAYRKIHATIIHAICTVIYMTRIERPYMHV